MNDKKCVFCGKKADWDNFGGVCNDCYFDVQAEYQAGQRQKELGEYTDNVRKETYKKALEIVENEIKQNRPPDFKLYNLKRIFEDLSH